MATKIFKLKNLSDTAKLAKLVSGSILTNFVISLNGDLGSGKTTLVRGVLKSLGIVDTIKSPTFTLVEPYKINELELYHFDLYRFNDPEEWFGCGFDEYFVDNSICFIEWAKNADKLIPKIDWEINISVDEETRLLEIKSKTNRGDACLNQLMINAGSLFS